ncbi:MAG: hypothetical protein QY326_02415 [Bdellovibrionota bacterium]|nr:MAG: hypothetical protein QY326_02415 [Bdellovibrionota bacterium]
MTSTRHPTPAQLLKQIGAESLPPILHICTPDEVRFRRAVATTITSRSDMQSAEIRRLRAADMSSSELTNLHDESLSLSLFASKRVFILEQVDTLPIAMEKAVLKQIAQPIPNVTFVVWSRALPSASPWRKISHQTFVELEALKGQELRRWTEREFSLHSITVASGAPIEKIIEIADSSPDTIARYCEQLALYLDGETCTVEHIQQLFVGHPDTDDFALIGMINRRDPLRVYLQVNQMLAAGRNPFPTIALLAKNISQYLVLKLALERKSAPAAIRQELAIQPWLFQKHLDAVKQYSLDQLFAANLMVLAADSRLKGRSLGADHVLVDFVASVASR